MLAPNFWKSGNSGVLGALLSPLSWLYGFVTNARMTGKEPWVSPVPIICIGNNIIDKKLIELSKVCNVYELKDPTIQQTKLLCIQLFNDFCCI